MLSHRCRLEEDLDHMYPSESRVSRHDAGVDTQFPVWLPPYREIRPAAPLRATDNRRVDRHLGIPHFRASAMDATPGK